MADPSPRFQRDWRAGVTVAALLALVAGAWLFASGFWLAESPAASWNAWLLGIAVVLIALLGIDATEEGRMEGSPAAGDPLSLGER